MPSSPNGVAPLAKSYTIPLMSIQQAQARQGSAGIQSAIARAIYMVCTSHLFACGNSLQFYFGVFDCLTPLGFTNSSLTKPVLFMVG